MAKKTNHRRALAVALVYLCVGILWIFFSDQMLLRIAGLNIDQVSLSGYQTLKGWLYVFITAGLLYFLSRRALSAQGKALHDLYQSEKALQSSRRSIDHLLAASPTILYSLKLQENGSLKTQWVSESIEHLLGYKVRDAMIDGWWFHNMDPRDLQRGIDETRQLIENGQIDHEYRFMDADRQVRWIRDTARVIYDSQGKPAEILGAWIDISDQHERETQQRLYATAFNHIDEGVLIADKSEVIHSVNPAACRLFGYSSSELIGQRLSMLASGRHDKWFFEALKDSLQKHGTWHGEIWNKHRNGDITPQWLSIATMYDNDGNLEKYVAVYTDIRELKTTEDKLHHLAYHDTLTGLPNRVLLTERLRSKIRYQHATRKRFALFCLDLDNFKSVNDSFGHSTGDELLIAVAERLRHCLNTGDTLARLGGDEFALLSDFATDANGTQEIAVKLLESLQQPFALKNGRQLYVEACLGITLFPDHGDDEEALMRNADTAMYKAKFMGRNQHCLYEKQMSQNVATQLDMETALRKGLTNSEFEMFYQPKVDCVSGRLCGAEALLRWKRDNSVYVPPAQFIPLAERTGLIIPLGDWIVQNCCAQIREWLDMDLDPVNIAINISVKQFQGRELALESLVRDKLKTFAIEPSMLSLEITESAAMNTPEETALSLHTLKSLGITIALDDFGTGFSNMMSLSHMPIDYLKIDTSFTQKIDTPAGFQVVKSVVDLAHGLGIKTIAEGVETQAQLDSLRDMHCDEIQGFHVSRPLPAGKYTEWLHAHRSS